MGNAPATESIKKVRKKLERESIPDQAELYNLLSPALDRIQETPCTLAEILNAGWLYKCEYMFADVRANLNSFSDEAEQEFTSKLLALDKLLRVSIETAFVSKLFLERMDPVEEVER